MQRTDISRFTSPHTKLHSGHALNDVERTSCEIERRTEIEEHGAPIAVTVFTYNCSRRLNLSVCSHSPAPMQS